MKATPQEIVFHNAIKNQDDTALSKLYNNYGNQVVRSLTVRFMKVSKWDKDFITMAVDDAFMSYYLKPDTFDPLRCSLLGFLKLSANGDLLNLLQKEKKRSLKKDLPEDVELEEIFWNSILKSYSSTDATILSDEVMKGVRKILESHFSNEQDITLAMMALSAERPTEPYVEVLGLQALTPEEKQTAVKTHKDRIKKVLKRNDVENRIKNLIR